VKFIKLKLKNFKPYFASGEPQEIEFFDKNNEGRNITLNIGQNGFGKTSISESILWCLFGENKYPNWEEFVNTLSIDVAKEMKKEKDIEMTVELITEMDGDIYKILRIGNFNIDEGRKEDKLYVTCNGEPEKEPEKFITEKFAVVELMEYFIFDADDVLKKFEKNQEKEIRDNINKLVGVERLDKMIDTLESVIKIYEKKILDIQSEIKSDASEKKTILWNDKKKKGIAVEEYEHRIKVNKGKIRKLFLKSKPSPEENRIYSLLKNREELESKIDNLNEKYTIEGIASNLDLKLLEPIMDEVIRSVSRETSSKEEFDNSSELIKTTLGINYKGIMFNNKGNNKLIKKSANIDSKELDDTDTLNLKEEGGNKSDFIRTLNKYSDLLQTEKEKFDRIYEKHKELKGTLLKIKNEINQIGETTRTKDIKEKINEYKKMKKQNEEYDKEKVKIQEKIKENDEEIKELEKEIEINEDQKKDIEKIRKRKKITENLLDISRESRKSYLDQLINFVNKKASQFLRNTVKENYRFNSLEINTDYQFKLKQKNGEELNQNQINKGTLTISMLSFFIGLSNYIGKKIPYVIDNPMIRLDPGHDKRLIEQLADSKDQIILHLIPGKEYTDYNYKWMRPKINIQNWIYRNEWEERDDLISTIERKKRSELIEFDIDEF